MQGKRRLPDVERQVPLFLHTRLPWLKRLVGLLSLIVSNVSGQPAGPARPTVSAFGQDAQNSWQVRVHPPQADKAWESRFPGMFRVTDGMLRTREISGPGLGAPEI